MFFRLVYGYKIRNGNFLRLNKNFVSCSFTSLMASKTKTGRFYDLIRPSFLVLVYGFNFQQGKFLYLTRCLFYYFVYSYKIYQSFNYKNGTDKIAGKIGMSDEITLKSEILPDNVWPLGNSYFAPCAMEFFAKLVNRWSKSKH